MRFSLCHRVADRDQADEQGCVGDNGGGCCKAPEVKKDEEPTRKSTNPLNPKSKEEDWEFVKNFIDKS